MNLSPKGFRNKCGLSLPLNTKKIQNENKNIYKNPTHAYRVQFLAWTSHTNGSRSYRQVRSKFNNTANNIISSNTILSCMITHPYVIFSSNEH